MRLLEFLGGPAKKPGLQEKKTDGVEKIVEPTKKPPFLKRVPDGLNTGYWAEKDTDQEEPETDYRPEFIKQKNEAARLIKTAGDKERQN